MNLIFVPDYRCAYRLKKNIIVRKNLIKSGITGLERSASHGHGHFSKMERADWLFRSRESSVSQSSSVQSTIEIDNNQIKYLKKPKLAFNQICLLICD